MKLVRRVITDADIEDSGDIYVAGYLEYNMKKQGKEPTTVPKKVWELVPKEDRASYDVKDKGDSVEVRYDLNHKDARLKEQEAQHERRNDNQLS